jgi:hypothetical protein
MHQMATDYYGQKKQPIKFTKDLQINLTNYVNQMNV